MDDLIKMRSVLKAKLSRFDTFLANHGIENRDQVKVRLEKIANLDDDYELIQTEIEQIDSSQESDRQIFEDKFFEIVTKVNKIINSQVSEALKTNSQLDNSHSNSSFTTNKLNVKLPKISLPEFNGSYERWLQFSDAFNSLIHENIELNNVQKFYYLRSCLRGDAAHVINALEASDTNYQVAWDLLRNRFENKRIIVHSHVRELFDFASATRESYIHLRKLCDHYQKHIRSLKTLGLPTDSWDTLLIHMIVFKLDIKTKRSWEASIKSNTLPDLKQLFEFLSNQCMILESVEKGKQESSNKTNTMSCMVTKNQHGKQCQENHGLYQCKKFLDLSPKQRYEKVKNWKLCVNCLRFGHTNANCKSSNCKKCDRAHNTLLHFDRSQIENPQRDETQATELVNAHSIFKRNEYVLLSTALVWLKDARNNWVKCRALVDSGSQSNFVTKQLTEKLRLKQSKVTNAINGINQSTFHASSLIQTELTSLTKQFNRKLSFIIIDTITDQLPQQRMYVEKFYIPDALQLADPSFYQPGNIDVLLGASVFFELLLVGQIKLDNAPILQKTRLGWLVSGPITASLNNQSCFFITNSSKKNADLADAMEKFWRIEEPATTAPLWSKEESECESHFQTTFKREPDGRFCVSLPLKENWHALGESFETAKHRLESMENKFAKNPDLKIQYSEFMLEYESMGHMSLIPEYQIKSDELVNYLPHHCVFKSSSTTTKLRVVFDASTKTSSGLSLNDVLKVGPALQDDLLAICYRFRTYNYVLTGDIAKMYRQINIESNQKNLQRVLWRNEPNETIRRYILNTVTYGMASASFLSTRCLQQLAEENDNIYPHASKVLRRDFYMDDLLTGSNTVDSLLTLKQELVDILSQGKFDLRKFNSNCQEINDNSDIKDLTLVEAKILGISWDAKADLFKFTAKINLNRNRLTKRSILATVSQIFDPLGLVGPVVLRGKLLLQKLWQQRADWDETVSHDLYLEARNFFDDVMKLNNITVPRQVTLSKCVLYKICGFCDASEIAYGCCIYIRTVDEDGQIAARLLTAKSKVAPIRTLTITRLELSAALLLTRLANVVKRSLHVPIDKIWNFFDSRIVLAWLRASPHTLKTFVANRVNEIQIILLVTLGSMYHREKTRRTLYREE